MKALPELVEGCREQRLFGRFDKLSDRKSGVAELVEATATGRVFSVILL